MNFFEAQERARKSSRLLVWWFILAMLGVIIVMYFLAIALAHFLNLNAGEVTEARQLVEFQLWRPELLGWVGLVVGGVILIGSWSKLAQLSKGGSVVARDLGGRQIEPTTTDLAEKRLLNIVEEMAIASGVPVPEVWLLNEEAGINAFAAGTDPSNAVIGVTRGTLRNLNRDELQGVVAHEFSHILNGDMKLNLRLMGWIFGLVMLSMLGRLLLESFVFVRGSRDSKAGGAIVAVIVAGVAIWAVGSIGILFARMIQAAISRQREYLADASAVQFTRNPDGISGALKKIGGFQEHGRIRAAKAAEARHMFFAGSSLNRLLATHPPLEKRIKAIDPQWNGELVSLQKSKGSVVGEHRVSNFSGEGSSHMTLGNVSELGDSELITLAKGEMIRDELRESRLTSFSKDEAKNVVFGLLIANDKGGIAVAQKLLQDAQYEESDIKKVAAWAKELSSYSSAKKIALVDLSLSWLKKMSMAEADEFVKLTEAIILADGEVDLFEFMLQKVVERHVVFGLGLAPVPRMRYRSLVELEMPLGSILWTFAKIGGGLPALESALEEYKLYTGRTLPSMEPGLGALAEALPLVDAATPLVKKQVLRLCSMVVLDDGVIDDQENELLRATAEAIGAALPPTLRKM